MTAETFALSRRHARYPPPVWVRSWAQAALKQGTGGAEAAVILSALGWALSALTWTLAALKQDSGGAEAGMTLSALTWTLSALKWTLAAP